MPIRPSKFFPESALAHELLDGFVGLEVGGAARAPLTQILKNERNQHTGY